MVFSSPIFLFIFLPLVVLVYFVFSPRHRNGLLLLASTLFYSWGEGVTVWVIFASIAMNYMFSRLIDSYDQKKKILALGVAVNLTLLGWFKYANFIAENIDLAVGYFGFQTFPHPNIHLPLGISFFTFHAISYLVDIYRGNAIVLKGFADYALYILLFPQLIAGPIIRYKDIAQQLMSRTATQEDVAVGFHRFVGGLGKKVLIANPLGETADKIFAISACDLSSATAWLGIISYSLQIYFDFSGYSDMAIGLMRIFGFRILENFNYPYVSRMVRDFWGRWHISLSRWFRDYLYIPLGGNRRGVLRMYGNLLTVFVLCGFWHGASWQFLFWGLWHGLFLCVERTRVGAGIERLPRPLQHIYLMLVILVGWVFFRADSMAHGFSYLKAMVGLSNANPLAYPVSLYLDRHTTTVLILGVIAATPIWRCLGTYTRNRLEDYSLGNALWASAQSVVMVLILFVSVIFVAAGTYNPFIYFRF